MSYTDNANITNAEEILTDATSTIKSIIKISIIRVDAKFSN
mgnify:CR=1 FL=1